MKMLRLPQPVLALTVGSILCTAACSGNTPRGTAERTAPAAGGCATTADCDPGHICMHGRCAIRLAGGDTSSPSLASLHASPDQLDFGSIPAGTTKTLEIALSNDGAEVVTVELAKILSNGPEASVARFWVESMGSGPFWIRPGRERSIFVTYEGDGGGPHEARLSLTSAAAPVTVGLLGQ